MNNLTIAKVTHIKVWFKAADWQLYAGWESECVAGFLNQTLMEYVNRGETRETTRTFMLRAMTDGANCGSNDTEPRAFLEQVLDEIYGA